MHSDTLWPGRPAPLPGEAFSSWFARTAAANGLSPVAPWRAGPGKSSISMMGLANCHGCLWLAETMANGRLDNRSAQLACVKTPSLTCAQAGAWRSLPPATAIASS